MIFQKLLQKFKKKYRKHKYKFIVYIEVFDNIGKEYMDYHYEIIEANIHKMINDYLKSDIKVDYII